jgi:16S rRNA (cytidine1402-2'-O)-methyltransferase
MSEGSLVVCATPIGNLEDVSDRLRATLTGCDVVYAEDTRRTAKLLRHIGATTEVRSLFTGNEARKTGLLVEEVRSGKTVALVSDAGMPSVSDPGARAVARAHAEGLRVTVVPGPSAVTAAVALSGFGGDRFAFEGFLPRKGSERAAHIASIAAEARPVVLFASPNRLAEDLRDIAGEIDQSRRIAVLRELTKIHEEVWVGTMAEALERWNGEVKGEVTVVLDGAQLEAVSVDEAVADAKQRIEGGASLSDAARQAAELSGVSRREIYQRLISDQDRS